jgi:O-antigen ligase
VLLWFTWRSYESFDTPKEALIRAGLAVVGAVVLTRWVREGFIRLVWSPLVGLAVLLWGWGWLSLAVSEQRAFTLGAQWGALHLLLLVMLVPVLLSQPGDLERLWAGVAVVGGLVAAVAVAQWFGLDYEQGLRIVRPQDSLPKTEIYSTIGNPNYLAAALSFLLPVTIALAMGGSWNQPTAPGQRDLPSLSPLKRPPPLPFTLHPLPFLLWGCAAVSAAALLLSRSKGGLSAAVIGLVVLWLAWGAHDGWSRRRWLLSGAGGAGLALILLLALGQAPSLGVEWHKLLNLSWDDPSVKGRLLMWNTTLEMVKAHPIVGIGTGTFGPQYQPYRARIFDQLTDPAAVYPAREPSYNEAGHAHNDWLQLAAENGLVGLALFMALIGGVYVTGTRLLRKHGVSQDPSPFTPHPLPSHLLCGLLAGTTALLAHALVDFPLHQPAATLLFWLGLATVIAAGGHRMAWPLPAWLTAKPVRWGVGGVAMLGAGLLMFQAARPVVAGAYQREAWLLMNARQWAAATPVIETGLRWEPVHPELTLYLGVTRFEQGDVAGSQAAYERYQLLYSDYQTLYNLGLIAVRQRQFDRAERYFLDALRYKPTLAEAAAALALVAEQTGRADEARRYRRQAVQLREAGA